MVWNTPINLRPTEAHHQLEHVKQKVSSLILLICFSRKPSLAVELQKTIATNIVNIYNIGIKFNG